MLKFVHSLEEHMEKLLDKLKTNSIITGILLIISATWIVIDYLVYTDLREKIDVDFGISSMLFIISGIAFIAFHLSVLILLLLNFRIILKNRSDKKKESKIKESAQEISESNE
ncbi:MAG: hypothetical protein SCALA702_08740 [Melioribacteraceae bacterium]|nr:MAG: hypothetical protein SCALA702_08740 [Melioribacteraceae bacterium]